MLIGFAVCANCPGDSPRGMQAIPGLEAGGRVVGLGAVPVRHEEISNPQEACILRCSMCVQPQCNRADRTIVRAGDSQGACQLVHPQIRLGPLASLGRFCFADRIGKRALIYKAHGDRTTRNGAGHAGAKVQRRAAFKRRVDGGAVGIAHFVRRFVA